MQLQLEEITAYTVYSSDSEISSSEKGLYRTLGEAEQHAQGSGWYGSDGQVKRLKNIYVDAQGQLYKVKELGGFTLEEKQRKAELLSSIQSKLSAEEKALIRDMGLKLDTE